MKTKITIWRVEGNRAKFEKELNAEVLYPEMKKGTWVGEHLEIQIGDRLLFIPMDVVRNVMRVHDLFTPSGNKPFRWKIKKVVEFN